MASETLVLSVTEIVPAEFISDIVMAKAIDVMVVAPLAREVNLPEGSGKTYNFPALDKDDAADITEGTGLSNNELTLSETSVTVAQVGILREVSKLALRTNRFGEAGLMSIVAMDAAELLAEMIDDDLVGLFPSITNSVGTTTLDLTVANMVEAIGKLRTGKARGQIEFVLDDQQALDLTTAVAASGSTPFTGTAHQSVLSARLDGMVGEFLGARVWYSNLCETANGAADVVGAAIINGRMNPAHASLGLVSLWGVEMEEQIDVAKVTTKRAFTSCYGVGLTAAAFSCKIVTDAP